MLQWNGKSGWWSQLKADIRCDRTWSHREPDDHRNGCERWLQYVFLRCKLWVLSMERHVFIKRRCSTKRRSGGRSLSQPVSTSCCSSHDSGFHVQVSLVNSGITGKTFVLEIPWIHSKVSAPLPLILRMSAKVAVAWIPSFACLFSLYWSVVWRGCDWCCCSFLIISCCCLKCSFSSFTFYFFFYPLFSSSSSCRLFLLLLQNFVFPFFGGSFQDPLFSSGPFFSLQPSPLSSHGFLEEMSSILFCRTPPYINPEERRWLRLHRERLFTPKAPSSSSFSSFPSPSVHKDSGPHASPTGKHPDTSPPHLNTPCSPSRTQNTGSHLLLQFMKTSLLTLRMSVESWFFACFFSPREEWQPLGQIYFVCPSYPGDRHKMGIWREENARTNVPSPREMPLTNGTHCLTLSLFFSLSLTSFFLFADSFHWFFLPFSPSATTTIRRDFFLLLFLSIWLPSFVPSWNHNDDRQEEECSRQNHYVIYSGNPWRPTATVCVSSSSASGEERSGNHISPNERDQDVDLFSSSWYNKSRNTAPKPDSNTSRENDNSAVVRLLVEFVVVQPSPSSLSLKWLEVTKPFESTGESLRNIDCMFKCPELNACISPDLWCDGLAHCPSGYDEHHCSDLNLFWSLTIGGTILLLICVVIGAAYSLMFVRKRRRRNHKEGDGRHGLESEMPFHLDRNSFRSTYFRPEVMSVGLSSSNEGSSEQDFLPSEREFDFRGFRDVQTLRYETQRRDREAINGNRSYASSTLTRNTPLSSPFTTYNPYDRSALVRYYQPNVFWLLYYWFLSSDQLFVFSPHNLSGPFSKSCSLNSLSDQLLQQFVWWSPDQIRFLSDIYWMWTWRRFA